MCVESPSEASLSPFPENHNPSRRKSSWLQDLVKRRLPQGITKRQIMVGSLLAAAEFFAAAVISIQAPFFPHVAAGKGATSVEYGLVFGIFELTVFIMSPIFGAKMQSWGPRRLFIYGIFTTGFCSIIFGVLNHLEDRVTFITTCFVVRTLEAIGDASFVVASFTIIALEFSESVATTFGTMETFYGLGMIAGPTLGGALYDIGGYTFPFATMGGLLFLTACASLLLIPSSKTMQEGLQLAVPGSGFEIFRLLKNPPIFIVAYSIVSTTAGVGYLHSTLEQHLENIHGGLGKLAVGGVFILNGGVYALTAPTWGKLCDNAKEKKYFTVAGSAFTILGFIILAPFVPLDFGIWNVCVGLVLFGMGLGASLVSAFIQAMEDSVLVGYPDDVSTYGLISGLWTSMAALGFFVGASSGGVLDYYIGFRMGTLSVIGGQGILLIMTLTYITRNSEDSLLQKAIPKFRPTDSFSSLDIISSPIRK